MFAVVAVCCMVLRIMVNLLTESDTHTYFFITLNLAL